jgi:hypothetical protein
MATPKISRRDLLKKAVLPVAPQRPSSRWLDRQERQGHSMRERRLFERVPRHGCLCSTLNRRARWQRTCGCRPGGRWRRNRRERAITRESISPQH